MRQPTYTVINTSYIEKSLNNSYLSLAAIFVQVQSYSNNSGICECFHSRINQKFTHETCSFKLSGLDMTAMRYKNQTQSSSVPKSTFRLDSTEEEKKMREITPLPYEHRDRLITVEPEDYISSDEEGDQDETF